MQQKWPEGPAADPEAARERYESDLRASRANARDAMRAEVLDAHFGLGIVVVASVIVGWLQGPVTGALVAGTFAALFTGVLAVIRLRRVRGRDAMRRAYLLVFGWGRWF
ncbi:hypothetical protein [Actinacidiphila acididurans]|uniref:DUF3040 domain-containing protein n=1 Tax=Actinacidiphila acididurans TaxID=2784346 RepID=A0ABS2U5F6_9ACTN|nr:hypothetical protein [Actinacidiphila acididurans]MBM9510406.1 hypothetical protein [Actinacidiphila acididurans]